jgi:hypothetical protein
MGYKKKMINHLLPPDTQRWKLAKSIYKKIKTPDTGDTNNYATWIRNE